MFRWIFGEPQACGAKRSSQWPKVAAIGDGIEKTFVGCVQSNAAND